MKKTFVDTNVIVYSQDKRDPRKQTIAANTVADLLKSQSGVISTQVLQEYAYTALATLNQREDVVVRNLNILEGFEVVRQSPIMIRRAVELSRLYSISFWDGCIICNAEFAGCTTLLSEDLNPGRFYSGIRIVNPFSLSS